MTNETASLSLSLTGCPQDTSFSLVLSFCFFPIFPSSQCPPLVSCTFHSPSSVLFLATPFSCLPLPAATTYPDNLFAFAPLSPSLPSSLPPRHLLSHSHLQELLVTLYPPTPCPILVLSPALSPSLPCLLSSPYPLLPLYLQIYEYRNGQQEVESPFQGRLQWNGSKDLQDVSITVLNVTLNDSGLYTCNVSREFEFEAHRPFVKTTRLIPLRVTEEGKSRGCPALSGRGTVGFPTSEPLSECNPPVFGVV